MYWNPKQKHLRQVIPIISCLLLPFVLLAQNKQANNWYFGHHAGITFNTPDGSPQAVFDGQINQWEGCASISDKEGNLLFYTDGLTVWNAAHDTMPNGQNLNGNPSATMSAIIVPAPGNDSIFYLFTAPFLIDPIGLCYSVVNMHLDNGLGNITAEKNIFLAGPVQEMVTAVAHANNSSIWVITHLWNTNTFDAFLVDSDSLHSLPVSSSAGAINTGPGTNVGGYMKTSVQGDKLAMVANEGQFVQLFDFDNAQGTASNPVSLYIDPVYFPYGIEFSPNGQILYVASFNYHMPLGNKIYQYDLSSGDSTSIVNSVVEIADIPGTTRYFGALQMGPDMRMYVSRNSCPYLSLIEFPDSLGMACNFIDTAVYLDDGSNTHLSRLGLPAFIQSFFNPANFTWEGHCIGDTSFFAITDTASQDSVFWDFGDPASGAANYSDSFFPYHIYEDTGAYEVSVIGYNNNLNDTTVQEVFIHPLPVPFLPADTGFCEGYGANLWPGSFQSYLWQNGSTDTSFYADTTLSVIVEVTDVQGCKNSDTTQAVEHSKPDPLLILHN